MKGTKIVKKKFSCLGYYDPWKILGQRIKENSERIIISVPSVWIQFKLNIFQLLFNFLDPTLELGYWGFQVPTQYLFL